MTTYCSQIPTTLELNLEPSWRFTYLCPCCYTLFYENGHPYVTIQQVSTTSDGTEPATHLNESNLVQSTAQDKETNCVERK